MTIKAIREKYKDYKINGNEKNMFTTFDYKDGNGKVVIVVNDCKGYGKTVMQVVRVADGKELLKNGICIGRIYAPFDMNEVARKWNIADKDIHIAL